MNTNKKTNTVPVYIGTLEIGTLEKLTRLNFNNKFAANVKQPNKQK